MAARLAVLCLSMLTLVASARAQLPAEEDDFEAFDRLLDAQFEDADSIINARYEAVNKAIDRAFKGLTKKIEVEWGDDAKMPSRSQWVTYDKDMRSRMTVDFEAGEVVVETLLPAGANVAEELRKTGDFAIGLLASSPQQLNEQDSLVQEIKQELQQADVEVEMPVARAARKPPPKPVAPRPLPQPAAAAVTPPQPQPAVPVAAEPQQQAAPAPVPMTAAKPEPETPLTLLAIVLPERMVQVSLDEVLVDAKRLPTPEKPQMQLPGRGQVAIVKEGGVQKLQLRYPFISGAQRSLIEQQLGTIREFAAEYDLPVSLVLAIIETESSFNSRAVSPIPAFGLMQLVPRTAGVDAYQRVHGEKKVVSAEFLFDETNNIQLGSAYISIVKDRYLRRIENPFSRFYCAVAAYNTGVGNVARTFSGTKSLKAAAAIINKMTEQQVFDHLLAKLPAEETRNYLRKIVKRIENYKHFDTG